MISTIENWRKVYEWQLENQNVRPSILESNRLDGVGLNRPIRKGHDVIYLPRRMLQRETAVR